MADNNSHNHVTGEGVLRRAGEWLGEVGVAGGVAGEWQHGRGDFVQTVLGHTLCGMLRQLLEGMPPPLTRCCRTPTVIVQPPIAT